MRWTRGSEETYNVATELLDRHVAEGRGDRRAVRQAGRTWTYRDLMELAGRVGSGLRETGTAFGNRVLLLLPDSVEFAAAYLGTLRVGAVAVPCNPLLRAVDFTYFLAQSRAAAVIAHTSTAAELTTALRSGPHPPPVVWVGSGAADGIRWEEWLGGRSPGRPAAPTTGNDPAFWLWTSGSTGPPKAAVHLHQDWAHSYEGYARGVLGFAPSDRAFSAAKAFHAYGLGNGTIFPFFAGAETVYLSGRPTPEALFETLERERPTLFFAVPTMYASLLAHASRERSFDLSSVRYCVSAGEPLPAELYRQWKARFGLEILDGIGSTEVLHIYLSARPGHVRPGSSGTPVAGYAVRIVDEAGQDVGAGTIGDLLVRGPSTAVRYWRRPTLTRQRMLGEWFVSGDKYSRDSDGYYWYVGRADDMFKANAEWVSPVAVESALIEHSAVLESAVVGVPDSEGLTRPKAFVVLKPGTAPSDEVRTALQRFLKQRLPRYACPQWIEFVPELPKNAAGKIQRFRLRETVSAA